MQMTIHPLYLNILLKMQQPLAECCPASLFEWFSNNQMKGKPQKCHILMNATRPAAIIKIG